MAGAIWRRSLRRIVNQLLFKVGGTPINFSVSPAIVADDSGNGNDATMSGCNSVILNGSENIRVNSSVFDWDSDFTIIQTLLRGTQGAGKYFAFLQFNTSTEIFQIYIDNTDIFIYVKSVIKLTVAHGAIEGEKFTVALLKIASTNTYTLYINGVDSGSFVDAAVIAPSNSFYFIGGNDTNSNNWKPFATALIQGALAPSEIVEIGNDERKVVQKALDNHTISNTWTYSEGVRNTYDKIDGLQGNFFTVDRWELRTDKHPFNFEFGCEPYDDGSFKPLDKDGNSLNVGGLGGATSLGVAAQDNYSFVNCESELDNTLMSGVNPFWNTEKDYTEVQAAPPPINYLQGLNKLNELET